MKHVGRYLIAGGVLAYLLYKSSQRQGTVTSSFSLNSPEGQALQQQLQSESQTSAADTGASGAENTGSSSPSSS